MQEQLDGMDYTIPSRKNSMEVFREDLTFVKQLLGHTGENTCRLELKLGDFHKLGFFLPQPVVHDGFWLKVKRKETERYMQIFVDESGFVRIKVGDLNTPGKEIFSFNVDDIHPNEYIRTE